MFLGSIFSSTASLVPTESISIGGFKLLRLTAKFCVIAYVDSIRESKTVFVFVLVITANKRFIFKAV